MTGGWWRRNILALAALALLIPGTALVIGGNEWWNYFSGRPVLPAEVAADESASYGGSVFSNANLAPLSAAGLEVPAGTRALLVTIDVDPTADAEGCGAPSLHELEGAGRAWRMSAALDWYDMERPTACRSEPEGPYTIATPFLVPADATGPFAVEVVTAGELPRFLRLRLGG